MRAVACTELDACWGVPGPFEKGLGEDHFGVEYGKEGQQAHSCATGGADAVDDGRRDETARGDQFLDDGAGFSAGGGVDEAMLPALADIGPGGG